MDERTASEPSTESAWRASSQGLGTRQCRLKGGGGGGVNSSVAPSIYWEVRIICIVGFLSEDGGGGGGRKKVWIERGGSGRKLIQTRAKGQKGWSEGDTAEKRDLPRPDKMKQDSQY